MAKEKLGPWHDAGTKPVHVGVYEVAMGDRDGRSFAHWDGHIWGVTCWERFYVGTVMAAVKRAASYAGEPGMCDEYPVPWRGLTK